MGSDLKEAGFVVILAVFVDTLAEERIDLLQPENLTPLRLHHHTLMELLEKTVIRSKQPVFEE